MEDTARRAMILRCYPLLLAAMLITAAVGAMDTVPLDEWHDALAWVGAILLTASAVRPRNVPLRATGAAATFGAIFGRLLWWWVNRPEVTALAYASAILSLLMASVLMWAWSADFMVIQQRRREADDDGDTE